MKYKKIIGLLLAVIIAAAGLLPCAAWAEPFAPHKGPYIIRLDGRELQLGKAQVYANKEGHMMVPLRIVAEAMKYKVAWNKADSTVELTKENNKKIRVKIGEDCIYYGEQGPMKTGDAAECSQGITYVGTYFVQVLLNAQVRMYEGGQIVITSNTPRDYGILGYVKSVNKTEKGCTVLIEGTALWKAKENIIVLNINADTRLVNPITDVAVEIEDIKEGYMVRGYYGPNIEESYPARATAMKLEVMGTDRLRIGIVTEVDVAGKRVLVTDNSGEKIWINITDNTRVMDILGYTTQKYDLKIGEEVEVYHSGNMTKSLPPQADGLKIVKLRCDLLI